MIRSIAASLALLAAPGAVLAQDANQETPAPLGAEQRMQLRCSAAFAITARAQEAGDAEALAFPPLGTRGREYFVRASAQVMDEAALDREAIAAALAAEARDMVEADTVQAVTRACLPLLPAQ